MSNALLGEDIVLVVDGSYGCRALTFDGGVVDGLDGDDAGSVQLVADGVVDDVEDWVLSSCCMVVRTLLSVVYILSVLEA